MFDIPKKIPKKVPLCYFFPNVGIRRRIVTHKNKIKKDTTPFYLIRHTDGGKTYYSQNLETNDIIKENMESAGTQTNYKK